MYLMSCVLGNRLRGDQVFPQYKQEIDDFVVMKERCLWFSRFIDFWIFDICCQSVYSFLLLADFLWRISLSDVY